jgi:hypothetical protein
VLSGLFSRKAAPVPVYVPLLPTPVNPKHKDETRMALTIAVNGCCIESMEDYVRPWKHLPSGDCDRWAAVYHASSTELSNCKQHGMKQCSDAECWVLPFSLPCGFVYAVEAAVGADVTCCARATCHPYTVLASHSS